MIKELETFNEGLSDKIKRISPFSFKAESVPITMDLNILTYMKKKQVEDLKNNKKPLSADIRSKMIKIFGKSDTLPNFEFRTCLWHLAYKSLKFAVYCSANKSTTIELFFYNLNHKKTIEIKEFINKLSDLINQ